MSKINIDIVKSKTEGKKFDAIIHKPDGKSKKVSFGAAGMSDFTKHKDEQRKERYIARRRGMNENWTASGYDTAGFWSRWATWEKPTLKASIDNINNKFKNLNVKLK